MRALLVIVLFALVDLEVSARHVSTEYISESKYRETTYSDQGHESADRVVKSKLQNEGHPTKSLTESETPEENSSKSKPKSADSSTPKPTKISDKKDAKEKEKTKKKDSRDKKSKDKDSEKDKKLPGKENAPINKEQLNFEFWNFNNIANYENNGPPGAVKPAVQ